MSILALHNVSLILANNKILDDADWQIQAQDKIALVGRNGAGKSTLLKLLQGDVVTDKGHIQRQAGLKIAGLTQDVPLNETETVYHFLVKGLGELGEVLLKYRIMTKENDFTQLTHYQQRLDDLHAWEIISRIETMSSRLNIDPDQIMGNLSGGMKRRVLLAAALIAEPDLLLLDEPTNHLDLQATEWLEAYLKKYTGSVLVVTHDRQFLANVATQIVEIDRGKLYVHQCDYETYLDRREGIRLAQQKQKDLFDKRLSEEETWIRTGIKARRTRNEGRVRALKKMRAEFKVRRDELGKVKGLNLDVARSGKLVLEVKQVTYQGHSSADAPQNNAFPNSPLINDFSLLLTRGDKIGIIGPNGCGKTTLIRLLLGEIGPDQGEIRRGTSLEVAYFDQLRRQLDEEQTVMNNVADGADQVTINGQKKHVASYLRDFLFPPERFNQPVSSLSGGERNRLLLAKLLAKPVNFLVLDEPTNDLDIETLELLETLLVNYPGTLLLISHDRAFINQVVTSVLIYEGRGHFNEYVGTYDDYQLYLSKKRQIAKESTSKNETKSAPRSVSSKLSYNEQRELAHLPKEIERLEKTIAECHFKLAEPEFYQQPSASINEFNQQLAGFESQLAVLYERWENLENKC